MMKHGLAALCFDLGDTILIEETEVKDDEQTTLQADLIPGMADALRQLKAQGHTLALIADTRPGTAENVLRQHGLYDLFDTLVISETLGTQKPDPRMFQTALDALGIAPSEYHRVVMVGNNLERDIAGANRMGLLSVFFHWNERRRTQVQDESERPRYTVTSVPELMALIARLDLKTGDSSPLSAQRDFVPPPGAAGVADQPPPSPPAASLRDLFLLDPGVIFLNHGSYGACPRPVFAAYQSWQLELERNPVEFFSRRFPEAILAAREVLGRFVGADPNDLVFVPNATTGLNIVARSLCDHAEFALQPGDEVLATDHEYGALDRTWRFICQKRGAVYINHPLPYPITSAEAVVEALWSRVTPRTRVLFISHVTSPTALILPIAALIRRARAAGILTVIDGAHAPGQVPLDLTALGVDFYAGNCHKWLSAPKGSGFLYARRDVQPLLEPLVVSWGWQSDNPGPSCFVDEQQWQGTRDPAAFLAVPAAIRFMADHAWPQVQQECHALAACARRVLGEMTGLAPLSPDSPDWYAQMVAIPLPACDTKALSQRLRDEYHIVVPLLSWHGHCFVRVSIQGYNTPSDVNALIAALKVLLWS